MLSHAVVTVDAHLIDRRRGPKQRRRHSNALRPLTNAYDRHARLDPCQPTTGAPSATLHLRDHTVFRRPISTTQPTNQYSPETF
uniref:Uncharacterized protein n=1 Tax=Caenorhabditis japonica TaxID=281687 RepID=A0A8R1E319_CAEJA